MTSEVKFRFLQEDRGNCRVYYRSIATKRLYCIQQNGSWGKDNFRFYPCTQDGEPEYDVDIPEASKFDRYVLPHSIEKKE